MGILDGKAVVISGAGRGIGAACARGAARQGAAVVVNDIDAAEADQIATEIVAGGGNAVACVADISDWEDAGRLIATCIEAFGKIDGLVNNAALFHRARLTELDPVPTRALVEVNVLGPLYCTGHAIQPMLEQGSGSIINVISGALMGIPTLGVYGATKGAVASMVYTWALELAGSGVRVNGLSPFGATRMTDPAVTTPLIPDMDRAYAMLAEIQAPEANSPVVEYLLSDLSASVNGQIVRIDKGELQLHTPPALLIPPVVRADWTAEAVAAAFDRDFKDRLVPCGILGMTDLPVDLKSGFWKRTAAIREPARPASPSRLVE
jgi:NAD(P)-dependent dehydrogenase (short-subunit alcohol dehydrogenase family)